MGSADSSILSGNPAVAINAGGIATPWLTSFSYCLEPVASGVYILDISDSFGDGVISGLRQSQVRQTYILQRT